MNPHSPHLISRIQPGQHLVLAAMFMSGKHYFDPGEIVGRASIWGALQYGGSALMIACGAPTTAAALPAYS